MTPQLTSANVRGQLGLGDDAPEMCASPTPVPLPPAHTLCDLAAGLDHVLLLTSDGRRQAVFSCGLDTDGQLGNGTRRFSRALRPVPLPELAPGDSFVRVAAGGDTSYLLSAHGRLWMWGNAEYGQALQPPDTSVGDQVTPPVEAALGACEARIVDVRVGGSFVVMLDGTYSTGWPPAGCGSGTNGPLHGDATPVFSGARTLRWLPRRRTSVRHRPS